MAKNDIDLNLEETPKHLVINLKTVGSIASAIVAILGAVWAIDSHYASAADVEKIQRSMSQQVNQLRIERTEDELFKLDVKKQTQGGKLEPIDQALHDRYVRRIKEVQMEEKALTIMSKEK